MNSLRHCSLLLAVQVLVCLGLHGQSGASAGSLLVSPDPVRLSALTEYLKTHYRTAEDYIISQFKSHDVAFLGESCHRCDQHELLLQRLIPLLYKAGVRILGYEMSSSVDQPAIDALVNGSTYD